MKERRSNINFGANETLILECKSVFSKINRHKASRSVLLKKLHEYVNALRNSLHLIKNRSDHYEKELSKLTAEILLFLKDSFDDEGLIHKFSEALVSQSIVEGKSHIQQIKPDISALVSEFLYELSGLPQKARLEKITLSRIAQLEKIRMYIECDGLLESEINKRDLNLFSRFHVQFKIYTDNKRRESVRALFLRKPEVEDIFVTLRNKGITIVCGKKIYHDRDPEILVTQTLLQEDEQNLYRNKHKIYNAEKFIRSFKDVTKEFYNNDFLAKTGNQTKLSIPIEKAIKKSNSNEKHREKMDLGQIELIVDKIKDNIKINEINLALFDLDLFIKKIQNTDLYNEFILLNNRLKKEEKDFNLGFGKNTKERNKIISAMLSLVNESETIAKNNIRKENNLNVGNVMGYCIRTGAPIPFNLERPLSYDAYSTWSQFGNVDYPENYCHFSGEPSNGETSFNYPILKKNWQKAKEVHGF